MCKLTWNLHLSREDLAVHGCRQQKFPPWAIHTTVPVLPLWCQINILTHTKLMFTFFTGSDSVHGGQHQLFWVQQRHRAVPSRLDVSWAWSEHDPSMSGGVGHLKPFPNTYKQRVWRVHPRLTRTNHALLALAMWFLLAGRWRWGWTFAGEWDNVMLVVMNLLSPVGPCWPATTLLYWRSSVKHQAFRDEDNLRLRQIIFTWSR